LKSSGAKVARISDLGQLLEIKDSQRSVSVVEIDREKSMPCRRKRKRELVDLPKV